MDRQEFEEAKKAKIARAKEEALKRREERRRQEEEERTKRALRFPARPISPIRKVAPPPPRTKPPAPRRSDPDPLCNSDEDSFLVRCSQVRLSKYSAFAV